MSKGDDSNLYPYQDKDKYGKSKNTTEKTEEKDKKLIQFKCSICFLSEICHYYGRRPPFARGHIEYIEDSFVMMDPFTPRDKGKKIFVSVKRSKIKVLVKKKVTTD